MKDWPLGYLLIAGVLLPLSLIATGCSLLFQSQYSEFPLERELQRSDLPSEWYRLGGVFEEVEGAEFSHRVAYGPNEDKTFLGITQILTIYPQSEIAVQQYSHWEEEWFPTEAWRKPSDFGFSPLNSEDQSHLACHSLSINGVPILSCGYLQQHAQFISLILANIDGQRVTKETFVSALEAQDIRLNR